MTSVEDIKKLAQWLREAFPKQYKVAPYEISVDTRPAKDPEEFAIILHDDEHKLLYPISMDALRHILSDVDLLQRKGLNEFEALKNLGFSFKHIPDGKTQ